GRRPRVAGNPEPAIVLVVAPAAVMIDGPGEGLIGVPIPAILVGIGPTADGVGAPARRDVLGQPDIAIARVPDPLPVRIELVIEGVDVDGFLRGRGTSEAKPVGSRKRQARGRKKSGPHERGRKQSQPIPSRHFTLQVPPRREGTRISSLSTGRGMRRLRPNTGGTV